MAATVTRIDSRHAAPAKGGPQPLSFKREFAAFVAKLQVEAAGWAQEFGFKGTNFAVLLQQVADEIAWWREMKGLDFYERDRPLTRGNWKRVLALHGISVCLDPTAHEGAGLGPQAWVDLIDEYVPFMRNYAPLLPPGPPRDEMSCYSVMLRCRERGRKMERAAEKQIEKIKQGLTAEKKRCFGPFGK